VRGADDVIEAIGRAPGQPLRPPSRALGAAPPPVRSATRPPLAETAGLHGLILDRLGPSPLAEDQLIRDLALPPAEVAAGLLALELEGRVQRQSGGLLSRADPS
jgi:DNA processing protein